MNSGTTMPVSSQNSDLKQTNKQTYYKQLNATVSTSSWWQTAYRTGARVQTIHKTFPAQARNSMVNSKQQARCSGNGTQSGRTYTGTTKQCEQSRRKQVHDPRRCAVRAPHPAGSFPPLLSSSSSARLYSCWISLLTSTSTQSQPPKLFGGIIHGKGGERRDRKDPGRQPCTLEVAHARQKIYKQARKFHHLLLFNIYIYNVMK